MGDNIFLRDELVLTKCSSVYSYLVRGIFERFMKGCSVKYCENISFQQNIPCKMPGIITVI